MVWKDKWKEVRGSEEEMCIALYTISSFWEGLLINVLSVHLHSFGCYRNLHFLLRFVVGEVSIYKRPKCQNALNTTYFFINQRKEKVAAGTCFSLKAQLSAPEQDRGC